MNSPEHTRPGQVVSSLALDASAALYPLLHAPPGDGNLAMHRFLKEAVEYSGFSASSPVLWEKVISYANVTLNNDERRFWLDWIFNSFTGLHPPDVDLSGWLMVLDKYRQHHTNWHGTGMSTQEISLARDFIDSYFAELDEPAFMEAVSECRARPLTDWDRRMHQAYGFVYFDRMQGADPFLTLKFVNQGEALRRTLRNYDFAAMPDFPHESFRNVAQSLIDQRNVWMPVGRRLSFLTEVQ